MIKFYIPLSGNLYTFHNTCTCSKSKYYIKLLTTVAKTYEKVLRLNKSESITFSLTKQWLTSISVDIRTYVPLKLVFNSALRAR